MSSRYSEYPHETFLQHSAGQVLNSCFFFLTRAILQLCISLKGRNVCMYACMYVCVCVCVCFILVPLKYAKALRNIK
jgi:hypothetical protein